MQVQPAASEQISNEVSVLAGVYTTPLVVE
jgi:hypothetical protein